VGAGNEMLLTVGVVDNRKNLLNSLRALQLLPERYRLVLAGGNGYGSQAVHGFIRNQRLESRVQWLGYVPRSVLGTLYQAASALLFTSREEGFGFPMLEAMSYGLPVVTSRISALPEVGGDAALYADPYDPRDIAAGAARAVEDAELRQDLIRRGFARASQFTWKRTAELTLKVYEELLGA
jgi:glycosyltransferase involved in cell wall biosynthesis